MRQFNYYGQVNNGSNEMEDIEEADVEKLEREIEEVLKNRSNGGGDSKQFGIVNISKAELAARGKSAGTMMMGGYGQGGATGNKRNLMSAAYR